VTQRESDVARIERALATTERDYDAGQIDGRQHAKREGRLTDELDGARAALQRTQDHAQRIDRSGPVGDAEQIVLELLTRLKQAASAKAGAAPDLPALRNIIGDLFEFVQIVRRADQWSGMPPMDGPTGGFIPFEGDVPAHPEVDDARYWLMTSLRWSAVDADTFKPIPQAIPVPAWQSYPDGFLSRYCWW
jgi:hypothetical protein